MKARKAKAKTHAEIRRNQRFKDLEVEESKRIERQIDGRATIEEALLTSDRKDEVMSLFSMRLSQKVNKEGSQVAEEMERKRRDEEAYRQEHERKQRNLQGDSMREAAVLNKDIEDEISRLGSFNGYEPF